MLQIAALDYLRNYTRVHEATLTSLAYMYFTTICTSDSSNQQYDVFHSTLYVPRLTILNLIMVSKINLQGSGLPAFSYLLCKQFKLERP